MEEQATLDIVREKFREGENVVLLFEAYQVIGNEHQNRLLALVRSKGAYAIFSFALATCPPNTFVDLTVDNIFPIQEDFSIDTIISGISRFQFKLATAQNQSIFYYYPYNSYIQCDFESFQSNVKMAEMDFQLNKANHDFQWLSAYKREDQIAINRSIADGRTVLKKRDSKFREELQRREHEYTCYNPYRIYIATWNVNGQPSADISLQEWLSACEEPPDIYAVAFQELDLSPMTVTLGETRPDPIWVKAVMDGLHPGAVYEELMSVRLVGMMLIVIIRSELKESIKGCTRSAVATGVFNLMGNKGGVGVSILLNESSICFINSHLAAHIQEVERRNEDHDEIIRRMQFEHGIQRRGIEEHDHIFWFGDLNYRVIDTRVDATLMKITNQEFIYKELITYDQLFGEMAKKRVFENYKEGPINFQPTYKYDPGTNNWDSSEKCRAPAWCDRILWKSDGTSQITYNSVMALQLSDHKPIYGLFTTHVKSRDEQKYKRVHEEVLKTLDKYENDNQPQITVAETDIDFGVIRFNEPVVRELIVANNCHLPVQYEFSGKEGKDSPICENWLNIQPAQGKLFTGNCISIKLEIQADSKSAWRLHRKQEKSGSRVLDILVLHVENGRDIFITIIGEYKPSCFGFNMETLTHITKPIIDMDLEEILKVETNIERNFSLRHQGADIPREIWFLTDFIYTNGLEVPNLFTTDRRYSKNLNINDIRDWLDSWSVDVFPGTPHTAAEALVMLLEGTPVPLIHPFEDNVFQADTYEKCRDLIKILSPQRKNIFIYVCLFLREVLHHVSTNRLDAHRLARIFSPALLKSRTISPKTDRRVENERDDRRTRFLLRFLDHDDFLREFARTDLRIVVRSQNLIDIA